MEASIYAPSGAGCYKVNVFAYAQVLIEWDTPETLQHEAYHLNNDYFPAFTDFKSMASGLANECMCEKKAGCIRDLILGELRRLFEVRAYWSGAIYDCEEVAWKTKTEQCERMRRTGRDFDEGLDKVAKKLAACMKEK